MGVLSSSHGMAAIPVFVLDAGRRGRRRPWPGLTSFLWRRHFISWQSRIAIRQARSTSAYTRRWKLRIGRVNLIFRNKCGSTNGICSRRSYISSAPLLQPDGISINKSSIRESSIHESIHGGLEPRRRQLSGWKIGVMVCAATAATVGLLNISLTVWAVTNHEIISGISYLYTGSCSEVANMSLWIHLGINAMSTMLLSASNCKLMHKTLDNWEKGEKIYSLQIRCKS